MAPTATEETRIHLCERIVTQEATMHLEHAVFQGSLRNHLFRDNFLAEIYPKEHKLDVIQIRNDTKRFLLAGKLYQYLHSLRVFGYTQRTLCYLDDDDPFACIERGLAKFKVYHATCLAALCHDHGKLQMLDLVDRVRLSPDEMKRMRQHPTGSHNYLLPINLMAADIALRHHTHQEPGNRYPAGLPEVSPEIMHASKLLGVTDAYDAAATRNNSGYKKTALDMLRSLNVMAGYLTVKVLPMIPFRKRWRDEYIWKRAANQSALSTRPTVEEVREALKNKFSDLRLSYHGDIFPHMDMSGPEFIDEMYRACIFGFSNPLDPFLSDDHMIFPRWSGVYCELADYGLGADDLNAIASTIPDSYPRKWRWFVFPYEPREKDTAGKVAS